MSKIPSKIKRKKQSELKKWMTSHNVYEKTLYSKLTSSNIKTLKQLKAMKHRDLTFLIQRVRITRLKTSKGQKAMQSVDAQLARFEILVVRERRKSKNGK